MSEDEKRRGLRCAELGLGAGRGRVLRREWSAGPVRRRRRDLDARVEIVNLLLPQQQVRRQQQHQRALVQRHAKLDVPPLVLDAVDARRAAQLLGGDRGRSGEIWGDMGKAAQLLGGDLGRSGEVWGGSGVDRSCISSPRSESGDSAWQSERLVQGEARMLLVASGAQPVMRDEHLSATPPPHSSYCEYQLPAGGAREAPRLAGSAARAATPLRRTRAARAAPRTASRGRAGLAYSAEYASLGAVSCSVLRAPRECGGREYSGVQRSAAEYVSPHERWRGRPGRGFRF